MYATFHAQLTLLQAYRIRVDFDTHKHTHPRVPVAAAVVLVVEGRHAPVVATVMCNIMAIALGAVLAL